MEDNQKIGSEDVNSFLLAENFDDLAKLKKNKIIWFLLSFFAFSYFFLGTQKRKSMLKELSLRLES